MEEFFGKGNTNGMRERDEIFLAADIAKQLAKKDVSYIQALRILGYVRKHLERYQMKYPYRKS